MMRIMVTQNEHTAIVNVPDGSTITDVRKTCQMLLDQDTPPELHLDVAGLPIIRAVGDLRNGDRLVARMSSTNVRKRSRYDMEDECDPDVPIRLLEQDECKDMGLLIRMAVRSSYNVDIEGNEIHTLDELDLPNAVKSLLNSASVSLSNLFMTFCPDVACHFEDVLVPHMTANYFHHVVNSHDLKLCFDAPKIHHRMIGDSTYSFQIFCVPKGEKVDAETDLSDYTCIELDMVSPTNELFQLYMMDFVHNCLEAVLLAERRECHSYA